MKIKCTKEEKSFLMKYLGKEITETFPWYDENDPVNTIAAELNSLQLREGFENQQYLNDFGHKCQEIYDNLLEQNG
ncbi:MAG: hypothetical protein IJC78_02015 [Clostridia bacterium]|nr:hypothetical protein [Clostridia bacterium]